MKLFYSIIKIIKKKKKNHLKMPAIKAGLGLGWRERRIETVQVLFGIY